MNERKTIILCTVIITICVLYSIFENGFKKELKKYLQTNSITELQYKTNNKTNNKQELIKDYISKIEPLNKKENIKLKKLITKINNKQIFNDNTWNIMKTKELEFGYSYTIGNVILLSELYINNGSNNSLIDTLMHEKMHINQRKNQIEFNNKYKIMFPNIQLLDDILYINNFNKIIITNPDANNSIWLIKQKDKKDKKDKKDTKLYVVPYIYTNNGSSRDKAYLVEYKNNKYTITNKSISIKELDYYKNIIKKYNIKGTINITHPNETFVDVQLNNNFIV